MIDRFPVLITQHMPPTFTTILAEHLARASKHPAHEAVDGEVVKAGQIYVAPGGKHMRVARHGADIVDRARRRSADQFLQARGRSAVPVRRRRLAERRDGRGADGMGSDGMRGGKDVVAAGGNVIAQDEATSVVWGMPGAAAHAGICAAVLPLGQIGPKLVRVFSGDRS